jgi:hypothetical protein
MIPYGIYDQVPFVPNDGVAGLTEKRLRVTSGMSLTHVASQTGNKNKSPSQFLGLSDEATWHNNHGEDPSSSTLNMVDVAGFNMAMLRPAASTLTMSVYAHAVLDGVHPDSRTNHMTANEATSAGQPVHVTATNTVNLADASSNLTSNTVGLAATSAGSGESIVVFTDGVLDQADWTSVIGTALLTPGAQYYLDTTAGKMSTSPPTVNGQVVVRMGTALTTTIFDIEVNEIAKL